MDGILRGFRGKREKKQQTMSEKCFVGCVNTIAFILFHSCFSLGYERLVCCISCNCCVSKALTANRGMLFVLFLTKIS